ncbi:hypothetical protein ACF07V_34500 [Streptomyces sp. NPDC015661]
MEPLLPVSNGRCGRWQDHRQALKIETGINPYSLAITRACVEYQSTG